MDRAITPGQMNTPIIKALADIRAADAGFSGGKGANLGELLAAGLSVPDGFVIGVAAYQEAVAAGLPVTPSDEVRDAIVASYRALGPDVAVAVRSSALAEDGATASHAGIYETALNVTGWNNCSTPSETVGLRRHRHGPVNTVAPEDWDLQSPGWVLLSSARSAHRAPASPLPLTPDRLS